MLTDSSTSGQIVRHFPDFHYDPNAGVPFESRHKHDGIVTVELADDEDEKR